MVPRNNNVCLKLKVNRSRMQAIVSVTRKTATNERGAHCLHDQQPWINGVEGCYLWPSYFKCMLHLVAWQKASWQKKKMSFACHKPRYYSSCCINSRHRNYLLKYMRAWTPIIINVPEYYLLLRINLIVNIVLMVVLLLHGVTIWQSAAPLLLIIALVPIIRTTKKSKTVIHEYSTIQWPQTW